MFGNESSLLRGWPFRINQRRGVTERREKFRKFYAIWSLCDKTKVIQLIISFTRTSWSGASRTLGLKVSSPSARTLYAAKVRNGFVPQGRGEVASRFKGLEVDTCPFVSLPERKRTQWALTKEEMKNCVWLKAELVAQIDFTEWTPDGHLRHSRFVGLREDKEAGGVVREPGS
jgi:ATP-dependent DNA ligase